MPPAWVEPRSCDLLEARRARWGISNIVVPGHFADAFAPVVARLAGT